MIMISDMTMNNYTPQVSPIWMQADNFGTLLSQKNHDNSFLSRIAALLKSGR